MWMGRPAQIYYVTLLVFVQGLLSSSKLILVWLFFWDLKFSKTIKSLGNSLSCIEWGSIGIYDEGLQGNLEKT